MKLQVLLGVFLSLAACGGSCRRTLPPEPPVVMTDAGVVAEAGELDGLGTPTGDACVQLRVLGCPEGSPNARGRTCYQTMTTAASYAPLGPDGGQVQTFPAECLKRAQNVAEVRACGSQNEIRVRCVLTPP